MDSWLKCLTEVEEALARCKDDGVRFPYYRGHGRHDWQLLPTLLREHIVAYEGRLYHDFVAQAGPLLGVRENTWEVLFEMRHHGMPTRILDWTHSFAVALYFAIKEVTDKPAAVWVLNPSELNERNWGKRRIYSPVFDPRGYFEMFLQHPSERRRIDGAIAISPVKTSLRTVAQQAVCTLHCHDQRPLEQQCPDALTKVVIPIDAVLDAQRFLELTGMNEYALFPDLDTLGAYLTGQYRLERFYYGSADAQ